jgi:hypothetical protein
MEGFSLDMLLSGGGGVLVAAASGWFAVKYGQAENAKAIKELAKRVENLADQISAQWTKLDGLSGRQQRDFVGLEWLRRDLDRAEAQIDKLRG